MTTKEKTVYTKPKRLLLICKLNVTILEFLAQQVHKKGILIMSPMPKSLVRSAVLSLALLVCAAPAAFAAKKATTPATHAAPATPVTPTSTATASERATPGLWDFRLSQFSVFQGVGSSFAASVGWTPWFKLTDSIGLRPQLSAGLIKKGGASVDGTSFGVITSLDALATYALSDAITLEAGPGYQLWINMDGAKAFALTGGGVYSFAAPIIKFVDGISAGYTAAFITHNLTHEVRIGVVF
jgi:hypothetical protein